MKGMGYLVYGSRGVGSVWRCDARSPSPRLRSASMCSRQCATDSWPTHKAVWASPPAAAEDDDEESDEESEIDPKDLQEYFNEDDDDYYDPFASTSALTSSS